MEATDMYLHIACRNLEDQDYLSKNDSYAALLRMRHGVWAVVQKTKVVKNNNNPDYEVIKLQYDFSKNGMCLVTIMDHNLLDPDDYIGRTYFDINLIIKNKQTLDLPLRYKDGQEAGKSRVLLSMNNVPKTDDVVFQLQGKSLGKASSGFWSSPDPYFIISKNKGENQVVRSNRVKNNPNPLWKPVRVSLEALCYGNLDSEIRFSLYDHDTIGSDDLIGHVDITVKKMLDMKPADSLEVLKDTKKRGTIQFASIVRDRPAVAAKPTTAAVESAIKGVTTTGTKGDTVTTGTKGGPATTGTKGGAATTGTKGGAVTTGTKGGAATTGTKGGPATAGTKGGPAKTDTKGATTKTSTDSGDAKVVSISDLLMDGLDINLAVAIDWTRAEGADWRSEYRLHYIDRNRLNVYEKTILAIGDKLENYDSDKKFAVYGFGGIVEGTDTVTDDFHLNGNEQDPACVGVDGVLDAYRECFKSGKYGQYGFANAAPIINQVASAASKAAENKCHPKYSVLLMIVNDDPTDFAAMSDAIVSSSDHPMSIIFVGVGVEKFDKMKEVDRQGKITSSKGVTAKRDNVLFLMHRHYESNNLALDMGEDALHELQHQITEYYTATPIKHSAS